MLTRNLFSQLAAHNMTKNQQYLIGRICDFRIAPKKIICLTSITHLLRAPASRVILTHRDIAHDSSLIMGCFREDEETASRPIIDPAVIVGNLSWRS